MNRPCALAALLLAASVATGNLSFADLMPPMLIHSLKECPEGLHVAATSANGMIDVVIRVDPDRVEQLGQNDLYKGRVKATCHLDLSVGKNRVAYAQLQGNAGNNQTVFRLKISATAASVSHLRLNTHLHEADGMPTLGGGKTFQVHLAGLIPADPSNSVK